MRCYVASSFANRAQVRSVHDHLRSLGIECTSSWADTPGESPEELTAEIAKAVILQNDADLRRADLMLVIATAVSGETFCEAAMARLIGLPIVWTGRRVLTSYREEVTYTGACGCVDGGGAASEEDPGLARAEVENGSGPDDART